MKILENLKPYDVFKYFEELSQIPRGSGNEKAVSDYLVNFGKELGLETIQDKALNVIIKKPATPGYENAPSVIIQGHMDMVCEKNKDTIHDFKKDPLKLRVEDDYIYATGTTLGADNGIALAYAMAILASKDLKHPAIEMLATTDEETGMSGVMAVKPENLSGSILLNIDSEEEGKLLVSCAGGVRTNVSLDIRWQNIKENEVPVEIVIRGLKGGHSGMEIDKERGNSNKLMGRILNDLLNHFKFNLVSINGGSKNNAIPRECDVVLALSKNNVNEVKEVIEKWNEILKNELAMHDSNVRVEFKELNEKIEKVFSDDTTFKTIKILHLIPNGVDTMSMAIKGLVQSSTNLGVVTTKDNTVEFDSATRSSIASLKDELVERTKNVAEILGAKFVANASYPEWQYNPDSEIREIFQKVYEDMTGEEPEIIAIHAGLECGLLGEKIKGLDMISFGPNIYDVHTPNEHLSISSTEHVWDLLVKVLATIK
ncbi:aminoacyl-histidine dipeptidase [Clostridium tarantellae]|uniref:Cytosol non-specific dipeptidase n=1 Tax=Clostridium tarantellae TaxID=39493 RepID=A0A6I1MII5_9CLOT|nr:aminoacyl-histidine dipeptidase [Clostridium tarantellae]MPQ42503.1 beta-Ala-His dipeptidase [Clostridium tarantellae]